MPTTYRNTANGSAKRPEKGTGRSVTGTSRRRIAGERRPRESAPTRRPTTLAAPGGKAKAEPARSSEPASPPSPARQAQEHDRPSRRLLALVALLLMGVVVEAGLLGRGELRARVEERRAEALDSALTDAPARAEKAATALLGYSHDSIDADIDRTTPFLTSGYADEYTTTMRKVVADPARQTRATVTAKVLSTAVVDASRERSDVLVFVNQTTESTSSENPRTALNRAILTMVKRDGAWVVSDLKGL